ncbi:MAG: transposase [Candidatus Paceibacterota bacterium]
MGNRTVNLAEGEYYHLYQRGTNKDQIFSDNKDRLRFLLLLHIANLDQSVHLSDYWNNGNPESDVFSIPSGKKRASIGAYCFMPNHFHLLMKETNEGGISRFMQKLTTGYSMYFNKKYNRSGSLFERPFKVKHINDDEYLRYMFAYIHLNPIRVKDPEGWGGKKIKDKIKARDFLKNYRYSSYLYYTGVGRPEDVILDPEVFPEYFNQDNTFQDFLQDWIDLDEDEKENEG